VFKEFPAIIQVGLAILLGVGIIICGFSVISVMAPLLYDYRVRDGRLEIIAIGFFPIASFRIDKFVEVKELSNASWLGLTANTFRTLRLPNRLFSDPIVIERAGILKYLVITPRSPEEFVAKLKPTQQCVDLGASTN
jgi:hypothetical protein